MFVNDLLTAKNGLFFLVILPFEINRSTQKYNAEPSIVAPIYEN